MKTFAYSEILMSAIGKLLKILKIAFQMNEYQLFLN